MGEMREVLTLLMLIRMDLIEFKEVVSRFSRDKISFSQDYNPIGKRRCLSQKLRGGLMDPEIRATIVRLKIEGKRFKDITAFIQQNWPGQPEKWLSRSTCHRFWQNVRAGRLREYGIEPPIDS